MVKVIIKSLLQGWEAYKIGDEIEIPKDKLEIYLRRGYVALPTTEKELKEEIKTKELKVNRQTK